VGEGLVVELARGEREPRLGLAPRVEIEELRGHVADLLGGALPGARPLIGAELVERGALGGGTGVTADEVQRVHRDVDAVPVQVLEHQEFSRLPADLERDQPRVAADAVLLVHHGGAGIEILQVAQDRLGIGGGALAPPLLAGPRPEELRLRDPGGRSRGAVVGKLRTAAPPPESSVSALKASRVIDAKAPRAASSSAGGRNNSAGESTGRSMSWRRSSWRASTSCHPLARVAGSAASCTITASRGR